MPTPHPTSPQPRLRATGVAKRYGDVRALDGVDLDVGDGERVALVGESGSGKTTLLRTFNRMVEPDSGEVLVAGRDTRTCDPVALRRSLGYVQQEGGLLPHWSVLRNVALVPVLLGRPDAGERARRALDLVGLPASTFGSRWPREMSGGQRQRAALARALAGEPLALLLDEPFGALDAITRAEVQDAFRGVADDLGLATLLVTHDLREAIALCHRVVVLRGGRVVRDAPAGELLAEPGSDYVARLLRGAGL